MNEFQSQQPIFTSIGGVFGGTDPGQQFGQYRAANLSPLAQQQVDPLSAILLQMAQAPHFNPSQQSQQPNQLQQLQQQQQQQQQQLQQQQQQQQQQLQQQQQQQQQQQLQQQLQQAFQQLFQRSAQQPFSSSPYPQQEQEYGAEQMGPQLQQNQRLQQLQQIQQLQQQLAQQLTQQPLQSLQIGRLGWAGANAGSQFGQPTTSNLTGQNTQFGQNQQYQLDPVTAAYGSQNLPSIIQQNPAMLQQHAQLLQQIQQQLAQQQLSPQYQRSNFDQPMQFQPMQSAIGQIPGQLAQYWGGNVLSGALPGGQVALGMPSGIGGQIGRGQIIDPQTIANLQQAQQAVQLAQQLAQQNAINQAMQAQQANIYQGFQAAQPFGGTPGAFGNQATIH